MMDFLKSLVARFQRLTLTLVSKQWVVFFLGTYLLMNKFIADQVWFMLAGVVIGVNVFQKLKGVSDVKPK
jgi:hypothetical protein